MELYIKNNVSDITYLPELIPHLLLDAFLRTAKRCGINSQTLIDKSMTDAMTYAALKRAT